jgi:hypothetical protein
MKRGGQTEGTGGRRGQSGTERRERGERERNGTDRDDIVGKGTKQREGGGA